MWDRRSPLHLAHGKAAVTKLNDACSHILPEMPRLLDICRAEEQQCLLLSHVCKILVEYASENAHNQILVNVKAMCESLRRAIEAQTPLDTTKYCTDSLLSLARCFDEAKATFLSIARTVHDSCVRFLTPTSLQQQAEEVRALMSLFVVLSNRGIDMTFGSVDLLNSIVALLQLRAEWMQEGRGIPAVATGGRLTGTCITSSRGSSLDAISVTAQTKQQLAQPAGVPDSRMALLLLEAAATTIMWHVRMAFWIESQSAPDNAPPNQNTIEFHISEMLQGLGEIPTLRAELPHAMSRLRQICTDLIATDHSPYVRFHAYSAYMCLLQLALGVSEKLSLEVPVDGETAQACSWGGTYQVGLPESHLKVLWQYLNNFYSHLSDADAEGLMFDCEGHRVMATGVFPAPSQGTMTSVRFLTLQCMQSAGEAEGNHLDRREELLLAVLASRSVLESEHEDIYAGPLGLLLLTQCERSRPKPLRDVALDLFRRLRELARSTEEFAIQFFRMQKEAVVGLFDCATLDAAAALSAAFMKHAGPRMLPWLEKPLFMVLKDAVLSCIAEDRERVPLLEVFSTWFKGGFVQDSRCREITSALLQRCKAVGIDGEGDPHVTKFLHRVLSPASFLEERGHEQHQWEAIHGVAVSSPGVEAGISPTGCATHTISAKRDFEECEVARTPKSARRRWCPLGVMGAEACQRTQ
mmetsp:Transcript_122444/g.341262  ORF Transcript_122444/g.341262 Transcript_122444/m.341262 type:complete len:695 (+) Transcript_122444:67-2151(+)